LIIAIPNTWAMNFTELFGQVKDNSEKGITGIKVVIDGELVNKTDKWGFFKYDVLKCGDHKIDLYRFGKKIFEKNIRLIHKWDRIIINIDDEKKEKEKLIDKARENIKDENTFEDYWSSKDEKEKQIDDNPYFLKKNTREKMISFKSKVKISGQVINKENGLPVFGALVKIGKQNTVTDEDGKYTILIEHNLPVNYSISIIKEGFKSYQGKINIKKDEQTMDYIIFPEGGN